LGLLEKKRKRICQLCRKGFQIPLREELSLPPVVCPHCEEEQIEQTIELDCPPGHPRPGDLYPGVIEGTGLPPRETVSRFFGNWTWDYNDLPRSEWERVQPILKQRITALYERGVIRYGSW